MTHRSPNPAASASTEPALRDSFRGWRFWAGVSVFWMVVGLTIANHLFFSMRSHGHSWARIAVWQTGGALAWVLLTPFVLWIDRKVPIGSGRLLVPLAVHLPAAAVFAALHLVPLTWLSRVLDPFRPVPRETSFAAEYRALLLEWIPLDLLVYCAILVFGAVVASRQRTVEERLRASRLRAELADARLRAFELEIRPHFLFNALNGINGLVRAERNDRASAMLVGLSDLLRSTLQRRDRPLVRLDEELRVLALYLDLQRERFGERLRVSFEATSEARQAAVPGWVLQPLVENAIRHAVEPRTEPTRISISAHRAGDRLRMRVEDDGPGLEGAVPSSEPSGSGIGLENLRSRLRTLYGDPDRPWRLELLPGPEQGVRVEIELPYSTDLRERP